MIKASLARTVRRLVPAMASSVMLASMAGAQAATPDTRPTVAVFAFTSGAMTKSDEYASLGKGLAEMLVTELSVNTGIRVVEREQIQHLLDEIALTQSGRVDAATAVKIGKLTGAKHMLMGAFVVDGSKNVRMDVRSINAETSELEYATSVTGNADKMLKLLGELGDKVNKGLKLPPLPAGVEHGADAGTKNPNQFRAMMLLSRALEEQDKKNIEGAKALYRQTLAVNPDMTRAKVLLASLENTK